MSYIGAEPDGMGKAQRFTFTASGSETVVSVDDDGVPIGYTAGQVSVYLNGVKLVVGAGKDCQATNGSTITGLSALSANDVIEVVALSIFSATTVEGAALLSTGQTGGTKFLREDGDGTSSWQTVTEDSSIDTIQTNIALLAFKTAVNGSLAKYSLVDQVIDEYAHVSDTSGIDASASTNEVLTGGSYIGEVPVTYGDGSDGSLTTSGNVTHTVLNKVGAYDGDMLVKQYTSLTVASGHTMTTDQPCRGMLIYVSGDCTIAGTLSMNSKGPFANPTASGGSDSSTVSTNGLQIGFQTASGSTSFTNASTNFNGCGSAAKTVIDSTADIASNGVIISIPRQGAAGAQGHSNTTATAGNTGTAGSSGSTGGGGSGSGYLDSSVSPSNGRLGDGSYGSCFGGGSGGGGAAGSAGQSVATVDAAHATEWGGAGGAATGNDAHGGMTVNGGSGNPSGNGFIKGTIESNGFATGIAGHGPGGLIILVVSGNLTVTGTISANGAYPNGVTNVRAGGSSGGGSIVYAYGGTLSNSGTIQAIGGLQGSGTGNYDGGAGGAGSVQPLAVDPRAINNITLQSTDTEAEVQPTKADLVTLIEDAGSGAGVINTDIKGFISRDSGVTFTEGTLVDEGDWGTSKRILAFHDLDISGQPADKTMCYKITTHNASAVKNTKVHATSIGWR